MRIVFAGGGTGGHLYPALALGQEIADRGGDVLYVSGDRDIENRIFSGLHVTRRSLSVGGVATVGILRKVKSVLQLVPATLRSLRILTQQNADVVAITGGYVAFPVGIASILTRRPLIVIEPNAIAGRVTKLLCRFAKLVISFMPSTELPAAREIIQGVPVRKEIVALKEARQQMPMDSQNISVLVLGGSQGAQALNETVPNILSSLNTDSRRIQVVHVSGPGKSEATQQAYVQNQISAEVIDYADDMPDLYAKADFVIARAGAGTVSELLAATIPGVLVPYPYAADDHQTKNATIYADCGGGVVVQEGESFGDRLGDAVRILLDHTQRATHIKALQKNAHQCDPRWLVDEIEARL